MISGNISAGKSSLGARLAKALPQTQFIEEVFRESKLLPLYYEENLKNDASGQKYNRFALSTQLEFLQNRFEHEKLRDSLREANLLLDRCLLEDYHIFAKAQKQLGFLDENDFQQYLNKYTEFQKSIDLPNLFVFLETSSEVLLERIKKRGRSYEQGITKEYLDVLGGLYRRFFDNLVENCVGSQLIICFTDKKSMDEVYAEVVEKLQDKMEKFKQL